MYINPEDMRTTDSYKPQTPDEWAEQARLLANSSPTRAMTQLQVFRGIEFRPNRIEINLFIPRNCEAALAYSRGQVMKDDHACKSCTKGRGPFDKCVTLSGYLKGSCSNCHYNGEGSQCSFRLVSSNTNVELPSHHISPPEEECDNEDAPLDCQITHVNPAKDSDENLDELGGEAGTKVTHKRAVLKVQRRTANKRRLAMLLYNHLADIFEEESDLFKECVVEF